jgi:hypothetical protein
MEKGTCGKKKKKSGKEIHRALRVQFWVETPHPLLLCPFCVVSQVLFCQGPFVLVFIFFFRLIVERETLISRLRSLLTFFHLCELYIFSPLDFFESPLFFFSLVFWIW